MILNLKIQLKLSRVEREEAMWTQRGSVVFSIPSAIGAPGYVVGIAMSSRTFERQKGGYGPDLGGARCLFVYL